MGYNPSVDYGKNAATTDSLQQQIAGIEDTYWQSILGGTGVDEDGNEFILDQDELRDQLFRVRALLGEVRVRAQEVLKETQAELEARKGLFELSKA